MQETYNNNNINDDEIDLLELFNALWLGKWIIVAVTTFISILGVTYSLSLPNIYESKALLNPVNSSSSISRSLQSYSGLAGIAGISLPSVSDESNSAKAMQKMHSLSFFENKILPNIFLPDLMALESWNPITNILNYDQSIYNTKSNAWIREHSYPAKQIPSAQESFKVFKGNNFNASEDIKSGFITLSVKHQSPVIAKQWIELVVKEINTFYKIKDKSESEKAISFLNKQIAMTSISEVKQVISELLQEETKKLALIEANELYVFEYIDPPAVMETKSEPKRSLICILSALLGAMLGVIYVVIKHYFFKPRAS